MEEIASTIAADGTPIAYRRVAGKGPGILFLGGFKSDMAGTKAEALAAFAIRTGRAFCRFDYAGHGESGGKFEEGCISRWAGDALMVLDTLTEGPQILVGSSMGGWIACLLAKARPERIHALVGIAPAPDFTEDLMWAQFPPEIRTTIAREGVWYRPSEYGDAYAITRQLIEDGRKNLVMKEALEAPFPVRILQGMADLDVPWRHAVRLAEHITGEDVRLTLIKHGDHRLSRPQDLALLEAEISAL
ncbi:alpha/beta hydrolase [Rhodovarius crocodyli]|uniref:Alpha/beta hydrolase n=1 Tax=Rhodovarius crocodyli TaxID=1979269 RepID=A0A437M2I8_9PROT|nr:alpha/beta hydrolase [Rhodovarius crocodyli]RVT91832.1 alpha/beta hydrolase [Rhodovarius crocodyli]